MTQMNGNSHWQTFLLLFLATIASIVIISSPESAAQSRETGYKLEQTNKILGRENIYTTKNKLRIDVLNRQLTCIFKDNKVFLLNHRTKRMCLVPIKSWKPFLAGNLMLITGNQDASMGLRWKKVKTQTFETISCDKMTTNNRQAILLIGRNLPQLADAGEFIMRFNGLPFEQANLKNGIPIGLTYTDREQGPQMVLSTNKVTFCDVDPTHFQIPQNFKLVKEEVQLDDFLE
ncbi:MAG: hypothetical protein Q8T09_11095 [Candidatus Melainabacteria bacterium]|nr:hypothetical protein [Candidatus Melainabacteria bacterium]